MNKRLITAFLVSAVCILVDQISKNWVSGNLSFHESIPIIGHILRITYTRNPGIAFGIASGPLTGSPLLVITLLGSILIAYILVIESRISMIRTIAMGMILGGAVGNLIDRIFHGDVVDFIDIGVSGSYRWPVFNVADAAVVLGLFLILTAGRKSPEKGETAVETVS